jgi:hypothetical protein
MQRTPNSSPEQPKGKPKFRIKRKYLLIAILLCGAFIIAYSLMREFLHIGFGESFEKNMINTVFIVAIGLVLWNRQITKDEEKERQARIEAEKLKPEAENGDHGSEDSTDGGKTSAPEDRPLPPEKPD